MPQDPTNGRAAMLRPTNSPRTASPPRPVAPTAPATPSQRSAVLPAGPLHLQHPFVWAVGIESSTLPHLGVDQFDWTQHNRRWADDLRLIREDLGLSHLRYSIPWHYIEPRPGRFDWRIADERIGACQDLGLDLMLDIMHFGTPAWLALGAGDPEFPEALERLTEAMVERYRDVVNTWCPVNEPLVLSLFSGDFGFWPPHARRWRGYMPVLSRVAQATTRAIRAIRRLAPDAAVVLCDAADHFTTRDESLRTEVALRNARRFLLFDLIGGRVDHHHPLFEWLTGYGFSELDLRWLGHHRQSPDLIGLDYYPHSEWQLEIGPGGRTRQKRADAPLGLRGVATEYYNRTGLPMFVTETSIEGKPINREIWLERLVEDAQSLREEGVPLLGLTWWPLFDHLDWDGALTHRIGKIHQVGLYKLVRAADGSLQRIRTPLAERFASLARAGDRAVGALADVAPPCPIEDEQLPPLADWAVGVATGQRPQPVMAGLPAAATLPTAPPVTSRAPSPTAQPNGAIGASRNGSTGPTSNGHSKTAVTHSASAGPADSRRTAGYGIVVFSHLRWGFVWQRPQQFLSRFARNHPVLFIEEPAFDVPEGEPARLELHQVMPNVTVACPHGPESMSRDPALPDRLLGWAREAIERVNARGDFDDPLLWYLSPMDAAWSLGRLPGRGVVYDCMDELSQFTGAPAQLVANEERLLRCADVVFTGGRALWERKRAQHNNAHFFGCGVEADHFGLAREATTAVPPDIDFMARPIVGFFGVIDERIDYHLLGEMARLRPEFSFAMVGPVVKIDASLLPHAPNLYWLGARDYAVLPNYCRAFDVCMMCFALNDATEYINPTKALEYLATGRPVVSTPIKDVVDQYADLMDIAATPEDFVACIERALAQPDPDRIARGVALAQRSTWDAAVDKMQILIRDALESEDRPSRHSPPPPPSPELQYQFARTPGS